VFSGNQLIEDAGSTIIDDLFYPEEAEAPRAMPAPPPLKGVEDGGATETPPEEEPPDETPPEEPEDQPTELDEDPPPVDDGSAKDPDATSDAPKGLEDGSPIGSPTGITGGTGTDPDGRCVGDDCDRTIMVHYSQLEFRTKIIPTFPRAAKKLGLTSEDCQVRVRVNAKGRPEDISILSCPAVFHEELLRAASKWRFYPATSGGQPVSATTVIPVQFRLN